MYKGVKAQGNQHRWDYYGAEIYSRTGKDKAWWKKDRHQVIRTRLKRDTQRSVEEAYIESEETKEILSVWCDGIAYCDSYASCLECPANDENRKYWFSAGVYIGREVGKLNV